VAGEACLQFIGCPRIASRFIDISNCLGDAISVDGMSTVWLRDITGTGNAGVGVRSLNGLNNIKIDGGVTVTGTGGEFNDLDGTETWANLYAGGLRTDARGNRITP
jgi:hypothetical protein